MTKREMEINRRRITVNGVEVALFPKVYMQYINEANGLGEIFRTDMECQISNCGYIVCWGEINTYFKVYEPIDDEYLLNDVYNELEKQQNK